MVKKYSLAIIFFISVLVLIMLLIKLNLPVYKNTSFNYTFFGKITKNNYIKQDIYLSDSYYLNYITIRMGTYGKINYNKNTVSFYLNDKFVKNYTFESNNVKDNSFYTIPIEFYANKNDKLTIVWTSDGSEEDSIGPYFSKTPSKNILYRCTHNHCNEISGELTMYIYGNINLLDYLTSRIEKKNYIKPIDIKEVIENDRQVAKNITENNYYKQPIYAEKDYVLNSISFILATWARENTNNNIFSIVKNGKVEYENIINSKNIIDNGEFKIENLNINIVKGDEIYLGIKTLDGTPSNSITFYTVFCNNNNLYQCNDKDECIQLNRCINYKINNRDAVYYYEMSNNILNDYINTKIMLPIKTYHNYNSIDTIANKNYYKIFLLLLVISIVVMVLLLFLTMLKSMQADNKNNVK